MELTSGNSQEAKVMNDQSDFLKRLVEKLSEAGIAYMLVGSVAASYHGQPRSTFDIDLVVDADEETLCRFAQSLGEGYFVSEESIRQAVRSKMIWVWLFYDDLRQQFVVVYADPLLLNYLT